MKKLFLLLVAPCVIFSTLSAQITQKEADEIVQQRLDDETKPYAVYAKKTVQAEGFTVITATGEVLVLEYPCWVYYVDYAGETNGKYLIVKENNGNVLEVKTKKDAGPGDLTEWKVVTFETEYPIEIPFEEYSLEGTFCQWKNLDYDETVIIINSEKELENYISCSEGSYPEIDFAQYTLLLASGTAVYVIDELIVQNLLQLSSNEYLLNVEIILTDAPAIDKWTIAIIVGKLNKDSNVELNVDYKEYPINIPFTEYSLAGSACHWTKFESNKIIVINNDEELKDYIICTDENYPPIDFLKYSLLLVRGISTQGIYYIDIDFSKDTVNEYTLNVIIHTYWSFIVEDWLISIITPKIGNETTIALNVQQTLD